MAKLSVYGIERYLQYSNQSLFTGLVFPSGIDRDTAINTILLESSEFECLYADADFLTEAIALWSAKYYYTFQKWAKGFSEDFSPIDNYDRHEEGENHEGSELKTTYGRKDTTTFGKKDTTTFGKTTTDTHEVSAFDSSGYQPKDKTTTTTANSDYVQASGSDSLQLSGSDTDTGKKNANYKVHAHGNIGVAKTTEILADWFNTYQNYNIYKMIADCFITEFCLMIY